MVVGAVSTVVQTAVYVGVREAVPASWASWIALLAVTPLNTELHRRVTFKVRTTAVGRLHWEAGLTSVAVYLANLAVAPWFAGFAGPHPPPLVEALLLALTGSLIGGGRYLLLRGWVFASHRHESSEKAKDPWAGDDDREKNGLRRDQRCLASAGSHLRRTRRSPAGRRSSVPDQRPASTR
ncbi:GtrA family protein [Actinoplanes sp. NPDC051861]|uniref:GtrA family protein n=1 Tax=Actinoplanes sp. NPDC051861 TaxID=3155170 RepID=UPI003412B57C